MLLLKKINKKNDTWEWELEEFKSSLTSHSYNSINIFFSDWLTGLKKFPSIISVRVQIHHLSLPLMHR